LVVGFNACPDSSFRNCAGIATTTGASVTGYGFWSCWRSSFRNCTATASSKGETAGFRHCSTSTFTTCTGSATALYLRGYGWYGCVSSTFDTCDGVSTTCAFFACSTGSSWINCTATPTGGGCDT
jgi:hypothetical protein